MEKHNEERRCLLEESIPILPLSLSLPQSLSLSLSPQPPLPWLVSLLLPWSAPLLLSLLRLINTGAVWSSDDTYSIALARSMAMWSYPYHTVC